MSRFSGGLAGRVLPQWAPGELGRNKGHSALLLFAAKSPGRVLLEPELTDWAVAPQLTTAVKNVQILQPAEEGPVKVASPAEVGRHAEAWPAGPEGKEVTGSGPPWLGNELKKK